MKFTRLATLATLAVALLAGSARASFDYVVTPGAGFGTDANGNTLSPGAPSSYNNASVPTSLILANPVFTSTNTGPLTAFSFNYNYDLKIISPSGGTNTGDFLFSGVISGMGHQGGTTGVTITSFANSSPATLTIGGVPYTVSPDLTNSAPPSIGNAGTLTVAVTSVPEPASIALLGLGGVGALVVFRRRKAAKA